MKYGSSLIALALVFGITARPVHADTAWLWNIDAPWLASQIDDIGSKNGAALDRYNNESIACYDEYMVPLKKILAAIKNANLSPAIGIFKEMNLETAIIDIQETDEYKCEVGAFDRLRLALWGPLTPHYAPKPVDWSKIDNQDNAALKREHEETAVCQKLYVGPASTVSKEILGGPQPKKAGDAVFERQGQILGEALKQQEKCDIKADMRLQSQLWSPPSDLR